MRSRFSDLARVREICIHCMGAGRFRLERNGGLEPEIIICVRCHGTGTTTPAPPARTTKGDDDE